LPRAPFRGSLRSSLPRGSMGAGANQSIPYWNPTPERSE
jgi:hypothetical protein